MKDEERRDRNQEMELELELDRGGKDWNGEYDKKREKEIEELWTHDLSNLNLWMFLFTVRVLRASLSFC